MIRRAGYSTYKVCWAGRDSSSRARASSSARRLQRRSCVVDMPLCEGSPIPRVEISLQRRSAEVHMSCVEVTLGEGEAMRSVVWQVKRFNGMVKALGGRRCVILGFGRVLEAQARGTRLGREVVCQIGSKMRKNIGRTFRIGRSNVTTSDSIQPCPKG